MMTRKDVTKIGKIGVFGVKIEEDQLESSEDLSASKGMGTIRTKGEERRRIMGMG